MSAHPVFVSIVLDGVGVGAQPDASAYGDAGAHTLAHVCAATRPRLPHLAALGLGCIDPLPGIPAVPHPQAAYGRLQEVSAGKDSTTGHWELAGMRLKAPFPVYPDGFPPDVVQSFLEATGTPGILGNVAASGTEIVERLGAEHVATGKPIVYTSADSVFQIATHLDVVPIEALYALCDTARTAVLTGEHAVGRVIARPFDGPVGAFARRSDKRKDYALRPPEPTLAQVLQQAGIRTISIGKIADLFAGVGFDERIKTTSNAEGVRLLIERLRAGFDGPAFIWVNLVDFDQEFGHRNDPVGFGSALEAFDAELPRIRSSLPDSAGLFITADHGNDPTTPGTDHSREYVPVLLIDRAGPRALGTGVGFDHHAATVAAHFGLGFPEGVSPL